MANLVLNGRSIDSIDDIAENFVEEDVLREFRSGTLSAWLEEYGYEEELERVRTIKPTASSIRVLAGIVWLPDHRHFIIGYPVFPFVPKAE